MAIFENKGVVKDCSNSHPHGQIWVGDSFPIEVAREQSEVHDGGDVAQCFIDVEDDCRHRFAGGHGVVSVFSPLSIGGTLAGLSGAKNFQARA
ncbi:MAG: hypothetical protein RLP08_19555 [Marinovum algicola]|uniref:hypothetical protein n=1 Tax=Marinovum algicola TaxID=42444 RepID=UPI0009458739|nr:hypothetical protein [Marinovum algicola]